MKPCIAIFVWLLVVSQAAAIAPGQYLMVVDGQPMLVNVTSTGVTSVVLPELTVKGDTPPVPPDTPTPQPSEFRAKLTAMARGIDEDQITVAIGSAFGILAGRIENGEITGSAEITDVTRQVLDAILQASGKRDEWKHVRIFISDELASRQADGKLATSAQYAAAYREVEAGLLAAAPATAIKPGMIEAIIKLVVAILSKNPSAIVGAVVELIAVLKP